MQINKDRSERKKRRFGRLNYNPKQAFEIRALNKISLLRSRMRRLAPMLLPMLINTAEKVCACVGIYHELTFEIEDDDCWKWRLFLSVCFFFVKFEADYKLIKGKESAKCF